MDQNTIILLIVLGCCALIVGGAFLGNYLAKKHIDLSKVASEAVSGMNMADAFALAVAPFLPAKYASIVGTLFNAVKKGINIAEALWKASQCPEDQRKAVATSLIQSQLQQGGVTLDDEVNKLISVSIDLMCRFMPKSHTQAAPVSSVAAQPIPVAPSTPKQGGNLVASFQSK